MRRLKTVWMLFVLAGFAHPGWTCPWVPPTDPCLSEEQIEAQYQARQEEAVSEVVIETPGTEPVEEASVDCEDAVRRLQDADPDVRLSVLDQVAQQDLDLDDCANALAAFQALLRSETDTFVLYRALLLLQMGDYDQEPEVTVRLLRHPSTDVRHIAARLSLIDSMSEEQEAEVAKALAREKDPWIRFTLATFEPEASDPEPFTDALLQLVREGGETAAAALRTLENRNSEPKLLLEALSGGDVLRAVALDFLPTYLGRLGDRRDIRDALLRILREGSLEEQIHVASDLPYDPSGASREAWVQFVGDASLPVRTRALLVLHASDAPGWRDTACAVKRGDPSLSVEMDAILADEEHLYEAMQSLFTSRAEPDDGSGTLDRSVRCAFRPDGPPRPGHPRLAAGTSFAVFHTFREGGVEWVSEWDGTCWIPADVVHSDDSTAAAPPADVLEADVSVDALDALQVAIDAGDLELFDPGEGFTGVRLREVSPEQRALWQSGQDGIVQVLAALEADARQRERLRTER